MKLCLTGGHITPAIRIMQEANKSGDSGIFIGRNLTSTETESHSQEEVISQRYGFTFFPLPQAKANRINLFSNLSLPLKFYRALSEAKKILTRENPDIIVSFGGYLALPVVVAAKIQHIPIITHEQTTQAGLANQCIGWLADQVAISYQSSASFFPPHKTTLTGNPLRLEFESHPPKPSWFTPKTKHPYIYVTGGSQGAVALNQIIHAILPTLLPDYTVIHQTGDSPRHQNFRQAQRLKQSLQPNLQSHYYPRSSLTTNEVAWVLSHVEFVIARSGANTVAELIHTATPSILIPLPHAQRQEQHKNAQLLVSTRAAIELPQSHLTINSLTAAITKLSSNLSTYEKGATKARYLYDQPQAPQKLYHLIQQVAHHAHESNQIQ